MIYDTIDNARLYKGISKALDTALDLISSGKIAGETVPVHKAVVKAAAGA